MAASYHGLGGRGGSDHRWGTAPWNGSGPDMGGRRGRRGGSVGGGEKVVPIDRNGRDTGGQGGGYDEARTAIGSHTW